MRPGGLPLRTPVGAGASLQRPRASAAAGERGTRCGCDGMAWHGIGKQCGSEPNWFRHCARLVLRCKRRRSPPWHRSPRGSPVWHVNKRQTQSQRATQLSVKCRRVNALLSGGELNALLFPAPPCVSGPIRNALAAAQQATRWPPRCASDDALHLQRNQGGLAQIVTGRPWINTTHGCVVTCDPMRDRDHVWEP